MRALTGLVMAATATIAAPGWMRLTAVPVALLVCVSLLPRVRSAATLAAAGVVAMSFDAVPTPVLAIEGLLMLAFLTDPPRSRPLVAGCAGTATVIAALTLPAAGAYLAIAGAAALVTAYALATAFRR